MSSPKASHHPLRREQQLVDQLAAALIAPIEILAGDQTKRGVTGLEPVALAASVAAAIHDACTGGPALPLDFYQRVQRLADVEVPDRHLDQSIIRAWLAWPTLVVEDTRHLAIVGG